MKLELCNTALYIWYSLYNESNSAMHNIYTIYMCISVLVELPTAWRKSLSADRSVITWDSSSSACMAAVHPLLVPKAGYIIAGISQQKEAGACMARCTSMQFLHLDVAFAYQMRVFV